MKKLLIITALATVAVSCGKKESEPNYLTSIESVKEHIQGTWESEELIENSYRYKLTYEFTEDSICKTASYPVSKTTDKYEVYSRENGHYAIVGQVISPTAFINYYGDITKLSDKELHIFGTIMQAKLKRIK
jgi:hypothetical protein